MSVIGHSPLAGASGAAGGGDPVYVDDVFSTTVYQSGSGNQKTITTGIDNTDKSLVWIKGRNLGYHHKLMDSERGSSYPALSSDLSYPESSDAGITQLTSNGFVLAGGGYDKTNDNNDTKYVAWNFRAEPKFFDVVTYTGTGSAQNISHSLGSVPGMIMIHCRDGTHDWEVYHRSTGATKSLHLNQNHGQATDSTVWNNTTPTSSVFTVGTSSNVNQNGHNYVAYVFAHDEQSFGTDSDEAIIKCGSYTGNNNTDGPEINLGFELQFLLLKRADDSDDWFMVDSMRGLPNLDALYPNKSNSEAGWGNSYIKFTSTGFKLTTQNSMFNNVETYIYMAIRRPHKPPTAGTDVFSIAAASQYQAPVDIPCNFAPDFFLAKTRTTSSTFYAEPRLTDRWMETNSTSAEAGTNENYYKWDGPGGKINLPDVDYNNNPIFWQFRRAPGFFDVVAYTGSNNSGSTSYTHNLEVVPELIIFKARNAGGVWYVYSSATGNSKFLRLNGDQAESTGVTWTTPTATQFTAFAGINATHEDYIVYLFASLDGISKIGTYSGTGSSIDVDCGFTAGARLVLIKRTDSTDDWYLFDSVRGINSGYTDDPYVLLNSNAAQVNNFNPISPLSSGFTVNSAATAGNLNSNGGTYLFLAIA